MQEVNGYHRSSLLETTMFRFKGIFGSDLRSRIFETQRAESREICQAFNTDEVGNAKTRINGSQKKRPPMLSVGKAASSIVGYFF